MIKNICRIFVGIVAVLGLSGCALTMNQVDLNYKPPVLAKINSAKYRSPIKVGQITDQRGEIKK